MKKYLINNLNKSKFVFIITLLDYQTQISNCLKSIKIPTNKVCKVLIDTALCSGINKYRFIEALTSKDGVIDLSEYNYVNVSEDIINKANDIIKQKPTFLESSVLAESQIKKILES